MDAASRGIAVPKFDPSVLRQTLCRPAFPRGECRRGQSCLPPLPFHLAVISSMLPATVCTRLAQGRAELLLHARTKCVGRMHVALHLHCTSSVIKGIARPRTNDVSSGPK